jgi:hypothetical protein
MVSRRIEIKRSTPMKYTLEQWDALVRHLNDGGCPVLHDHGYQIPPSGLSIEKIPGTSFNRIFSLRHGGTGYELELVLRNNAKRPIDVQGFQIQTPWGIPRLTLLPAPKKSSPRYPHYCFPEPGPYYESEFVLNPFFARRKSRLNPGEHLEGVLVSSSEEMFPVDVPHLARIAVTLVIFDSRGNTFSAQLRLSVVRWEVTACKHADPFQRADTREEHRLAGDARIRSLIAPHTPTR